MNNLAQQHGSVNHGEASPGSYRQQPGPGLKVIFLLLFWWVRPRRTGRDMNHPGSSASKVQSPTLKTYSELQRAYSYFNDTLFNGTLPDCLITLQNEADCYGFFRWQPFVNRDGERIDEISLNPKYFVSRTDRGVLSTLVHEMAHLEQYHFGKPGPGGYHNRQWSERMIQLGLYPSATGDPGGAETGFSMCHYIVQGGRFEIACERLRADGFHLPWTEDRPVEGNHMPPTSPAVKGIVESSIRGEATPDSRRSRLWAGLKVILLPPFWWVRRQQQANESTQEIPQSQCRCCGSRLRSVPTYPLAREESCHERMTNHACRRPLGNSGDSARPRGGLDRRTRSSLNQAPARSTPCDRQSDTPNESALPNQVFSDAGEVSFDRHRSLPQVLESGGAPEHRRPASLSKGREFHDHDRNRTGHLPDLSFDFRQVSEGRHQSFYGIDERGCAGHPPCLSPSRRASDEAKQENVSGRGEQSIE